MPAYAIDDRDGELRIEIAGELFTSYRYTGASRPYFYPVHGPGGAPMTRNWPMAEAADEERDHKHHRSLWFAHGSVNGHDFWSEHDGAGRIEHLRFSDVRTTDGGAEFTAHNEWRAADGTRVCSERRTIAACRTAHGTFLDIEVTLLATDGALRFGDTKEGTMAIRMAPSLRLRGKVARGHCLTSEGIEGKDAWGKRARWVDYWGPVGGETVGVAMFDHPRNHAHPTWWHARDYGLVAANPFGVHDFEKKPAGTGDLDVPAGGELRLRYRIFFHRGDAEQAAVAARYAEYAGGVRLIPQPPLTPQPLEKKR